MIFRLVTPFRRISANMSYRPENHAWSDLHERKFSDKQYRHYEATGEAPGPSIDRIVPPCLQMTFPMTSNQIPNPSPTSEHPPSPFHAPSNLHFLWEYVHLETVLE